MSASHPQGTDLYDIKIGDAMLGSLSALSFSGRFKQHERQTLIQVVFGLRVVSNSETILYSFGMTAPVSQYGEYKPAFDSLVRSFKVEKIGE